MSSALERALALNEILAAVLLQLDQQYLLVSAQRVCKHWHDIIQHTAPIRRYLFPDITVAGTTPSRRTFSPLLKRAFPLFFDQGVAECTADTHPKPFRKLQLFKKTLLYERMMVLPYDTTEFPLVEELELNEVGNPFLRKDASWLRMHVSDPPVRNVCIQHFLSHANGGMQFSEKIHIGVHFNDGLRMGDLYSSMLGLGSTTPSLLWPMKIPDRRQQPKRCGMTVTANGPEYGGLAIDEPHAEPDLVICTSKRYGFFQVSHVPFHSAGHVFFQLRLTPTDRSNFVGREINERYEKSAKSDNKTIRDTRKRMKFWDGRMRRWNGWSPLSKYSARYETM